MAPIRLQFDALEKAQEAYTGNISGGGTFVQSKTPRTVGTILRFELQLGEGQPIEGVGEVVWIRTRSQGPESPSGMGIQFGHLEESSRDRLKVAVIEALDSLGVDGLSKPSPVPVVERASPAPREPAPPAGITKPPRKPSPPQPEPRTESLSARQPRGRVSSPLGKDKKSAKPSPFAMSGRAKTLIVILGLLALLLHLLT